MIQGKRDSKSIITDEEELSSKGMTILQHLWSNNASTNRSTQTKNLPHNPLRVHEPLAIEFRPTGEVASYNPILMHITKQKITGYIPARENTRKMPTR